MGKFALPDPLVFVDEGGGDLSFTDVVDEAFESVLPPAEGFVDGEVGIVAIGGFDFMEEFDGGFVEVGVDGGTFDAFSAEFVLEGRVWGVGCRV